MAGFLLCFPEVNNPQEEGYPLSREEKDTEWVGWSLEVDVIQILSPPI